MDNPTEILIFGYIFVQNYTQPKKKKKAAQLQQLQTGVA